MSLAISPNGRIVRRGWGQPGAQRAGTARRRWGIDGCGGRPRRFGYSAVPVLFPNRVRERDVIRHEKTTNMTTKLTPQNVLGIPWVQALEPTADPFIAPLMPGLPLQVWHIPVQFVQWEAPAQLASRWASDKKTWVAETWQKAPLVRGVHSGCEYSCGEVELAARLRTSDYEAAWVSEWSGFPHVMCWREICIKRSELKNRRADLWQADQALRSSAAAMDIDLGERGGHPDVGVALSNAPPVYIEYKGPGDKIKPKQYDWARALIAASTDLRYIAAYGKVG